MKAQFKNPPQIRILIPEGSSLSAREAIAALGPLGYRIDVCDPNPLCVCRFSRFVEHFYRSPKMSRDPAGYLDFLLDLLEERHYDVLLPVHENAMLFSKVKRRLTEYTGLAVAEFAAFERLQSKVEFTRLIDELGLPHPPTQIVTGRPALEQCLDYPYYIKTAYGTAGFGTWRVTNADEQSVVIQALDENGVFDRGNPILVQSIAPGILEVVQSVFDHGTLVAVHGYRQTAVGVGGSAAARIGIQRPTVRQHLETIGSALNWHGSLMIDYLFDEDTGQIAYIDPNPRMGETMNAAFHGTNIAEIVVRLSLGEPISPMQNEFTPVESHILITMLLGRAAKSGSRTDLLKEIFAAVFKTGRYRSSREDFAALSRDSASLIPVGMVIAQLLIQPHNYQRLAAQAVGNYALTQPAIDRIREFPDR